MIVKYAAHYFFNNWKLNYSTYISVSSFSNSLRLKTVMKKSEPSQQNNTNIYAWKIYFSKYKFIVTQIQTSFDSSFWVVLLHILS